MEKLITIQKREKLNDVYSMDEKGPGGANHEYLISIDIGLQVPIEVKIQMQNGARKDENSIQGVCDQDLLEIVKHILECFQTGPYSSRENAMALTHIEEALMWLNRRIEDRIERNVLGAYKK